MNDNFDLRTYMTSKRLLTENYEPQISEEELNDEEVDETVALESEENAEVEGSYPWSDQLKNNDEETESSNKPFGNPEWENEPESLVDQNAEYRTDYKEEPDGFNYMEEESLEESDDEFSEDKLMSDLNEGEEDMISENDWSPLIPVLAGATGVILTSMGISKVLDSLRNGKLGEEGKKLADALKKLGTKNESSNKSFDNSKEEEDDKYLEEDLMDELDENSFQPSPSQPAPSTSPTIKPGEQTRRRTLTPPDDAPSTGPKASLEVEDEKELADKIGERFNELKQDKAVNERMQILAGLK